MNKPTLYKIGAIVPKPWMSPQIKGKAATLPAIDFLVDYIADRIPTTKRTLPKIVPKSPGDVILELRSGTGSGKSTVIAPAVYKRIPCSIVVTQPRVLTAVEIVHDIVRRNEDLNLGDNIGYQTGVIRKKPMKRKGINFMTTGILLQQFKTKGVEWVATTYNLIIIDEIHERSLESEQVLRFIKRLINEHWNKICPMIILTSATFNEKLYQSYFGIPAANFLEVEGFTYAITEIWQKHDVQNYASRTVDLVRRIHMTNLDDFKKHQRDIIIFVKGAADITFLLDAIMLLNNDPEVISTAGPIYPLGLNREIFIESGRRYQDIMAHLDTVKIASNKAKPTRRVIIATNVAETGVTIDTLKHCIDTGYYMNVWNDPVFDTEVIMGCPITRFMALQRRGRVGRKAPGMWYPMYTKETFDNFQEDQPSKLITEDITIPLLNMIVTDSEAKFEEEEKPEEFKHDVLDIYLDDRERRGVTKRDDQYTQVIEKEKTTGLYRVKTEKPWSPFDLDLIELPGADSLYTALDKLLTLGFIDDNFKPTMLGCKANMLRKISPESTRMVFAGYSYGANILDLITIAAFIEVGWQSISSVARFKYQPRNPIDDQGKLAAKILWGCEFIELLWIWYDFTEQVDKLAKSKQNVMDKLHEWCDANGFLLHGLLEVVVRRDELVANFITCDMNPFYNGLQLERGTYNLSDIIRRDQDLGMREVQKIKRCLVDGFRYYVCQWQSKTMEYVSMYRHIPVHIDSYLVRTTQVMEDVARPKTIIMSGIILRQKFQSDIFEYSPSGAISILDGFVSLDEQLIT